MYLYSVMFRKIICYFLASLFLAGSVILPLGDFSLLRDLPKMYQNYTQITSQEEIGIADFIGDYLLHGKDIFGHNEHDKVPTKGNEIQFQHMAGSLNIVFQEFPLPSSITRESIVIHPLFNQLFLKPGFANELFRPPLA